jgi:triacylglycerol esterase/lipase EstA (alpha/beta hydrolase family)
MGWQRVKPRLAAFGLVLVATFLMAASASAATSTGVYAPLDRPGPALSVPAATLHSALACTLGVTHAARDPILLVPGTNLEPQSNYSWNYERAFSALGWPYCSISLPYDTMGDIQVAGEYIVYALRTMSSMSSRKVDVLGFSQGGMVPRWALRFWPDTRSLVNEFVGLDPSNHGTLDTDVLCHAACPPAYWQQASQSHFIAALNSGVETFEGIDYTVVYSHTDEIVVPNLSASGSSSLHTGGGKIANIAVQQICPADTSDHLAMGSYDAVGYALAIDAFTHAGPGDPARISASVCTQPFQPGVDPATFATDYASYLSAVGQAGLQSPEVSAEPALACYVFASCQQTAGSGSQTSGSGRFSCSSPSGRIAGRSLGPVSLGMTRAQARRLFASSSTRHHRYEDFFCPARRGIRVGYASPALLRQLVPRARRGLSGRVVLVLTASPHYAIRGVHAESSLVTARRHLRLQRVFHVGRNDWYLAADGDVRVVLKVRRGVVQEIGIADDDLTAPRRRASGFLRSLS